MFSKEEIINQVVDKYPVLKEECIKLLQTDNELGYTSTAFKMRFKENLMDIFLDNCNDIIQNYFTTKRCLEYLKNNTQELGSIINYYSIFHKEKECNIKPIDIQAFLLPYLLNHYKIKIIKYIKQL